MLEHLTTVETNYYVGSLSDEPPHVSVPTVGRLHEVTAERLHALPEEALGACSGDKDRAAINTARKVIRRIMAHKRFHTREIEQRLAG
jgi:hypothetical protein